MKEETQSSGTGGGRRTSLTVSTKPKTNLQPSTEGGKERRKKEKKWGGKTWVK
jgi:hypothetical protein